MTFFPRTGFDFLGLLLGKVRELFASRRLTHQRVRRDGCPPPSNANCVGQTGNGFRAVQGPHRELRVQHLTKAEMEEVLD